MIQRDIDNDFMHEALILAQKGQWTAHPNPCVGCVIVKDQKIVGKGLHWKTGLAHAEVNALKEAGESAKGATCYVTLEPCCHVGHTGSCVEALMQAGIKRVVFATNDPNPLVKEKGEQLLKKNGIAVEVGVLAKEATLLNIGFFSRMERQKPYVRAKIAMSLDGRIAMKNGQSQWITSVIAREDGHRWRAKSSAILTSSNTVLKDNCRLTARKLQLSLPKEVTFAQPLRVILDTKGRVPPHAAIFEQPGATTVFISQKYQKTKDNQVAVPEKNALLDIEKVFCWLAEKKMNTVLVEAGPTLLGTMLKENTLDELIVYIAPKLLGHEALPMIYLKDMIHLSDEIGGEFIKIEQLGVDVKMQIVLSDFARRGYGYSSN